MKSILVVGPSWIGDMVMAQSLFISLARQYPSAKLDVLAPAWSEPILQRMHEVNRSISQPVGHGSVQLSVRYQLGKSLRKCGYDMAIVLPRSFKASLVPYFANIKRRVGFRGEFRYGLINDMRPLDKSVLTQTVQRFVALGQPADADLPPEIAQPRLEIDEDNRSEVLRQLNLNLDKPVVAMMPGAEYGPAKCWPIPYYADLARRLITRGYQVWLLGSEKDHSSAQQVVRHSESVVENLCGRTSLADAVDLLSLPELVVCNDSGLMHVAAAVGQHVVAIYGSSTPAYTPPLTDNASIIYAGLECSPCFKRECPLGHTNCLNDITVDRVLSELEPVLAGPHIS